MIHSKTDKAATLASNVAKFPTTPLFQSEDESDSSSLPQLRSITGGEAETHFAVLSFLLELSVSGVA